MAEEIAKTIALNLASSAIYDIVLNVGVFLVTTPSSDPYETVCRSYLGIHRLNDFVEKSGIKSGQLRGLYARDPEHLRDLLLKIQAECALISKLRAKYVVAPTPPTAPEDVAAASASVSGSVEQWVTTSSEPAQSDSNQATPSQLEMASPEVGSGALQAQGTSQSALLLLSTPSFERFRDNIGKWGEKGVHGVSDMVAKFGRRVVWTVTQDQANFVRAQASLHELLDALERYRPSASIQAGFYAECTRNIAPELADIVRQVRTSLDIRISQKELQRQNRGVNDNQPPRDLSGQVIETDFRGYTEEGLFGGSLVDGPSIRVMTITTDDDEATSPASQTEITVLVEPHRVGKGDSSWNRLALLCYSHRTIAFPPELPLMRVHGRVRVSHGGGSNWETHYLIYVVPTRLLPPMGIPQTHAHTLLSVTSETSYDDGLPLVLPSLEARAGLAKALVGFVSEYHSMGWVHKRLCAANVVFFGAADAAAGEDGSSGGGLLPARHLRDLEHPFVIGFGYAREGKDSVHSEKPEDEEHERLYRHPEYRSGKTASFRPRYDVFSLGVLLLVVAGFDSGLAAELEQDGGVLPPRKVQRLEFNIGKRFASVICGCLTGEFTSSSGTVYRLTDKGLIEFETQIVGEMADIYAGMTQQVQPVAGRVPSAQGPSTTT